MIKNNCLNYASISTGARLVFISNSIIKRISDRLKVNNLTDGQSFVGFNFLCTKNNVLNPLLIR
jgi:hypothetical protein